MALRLNVTRWLPFGTRAEPEDIKEATPYETGKVSYKTLAFELQSGVPDRLRGHPSAALPLAELEHSKDAPGRASQLLRHSLEPLRTELIEHPIYDAVDTLPRLRTFMTMHVYAVWDFMCLAKRLQRDFTSLDKLWLPPKRPSLARFINGLIHGEESDLDPDGGAQSHLQLYLAAMEEVLAPSEDMRRFLSLIEYGTDPDLAMTLVNAPLCVRVFVGNTLHTVEHGSSVEVLSAFLFGREDLIPAMFARLLPRWREARTARNFAYYVERHIELDGDDHGPAAEQALAELCGSDLGAWQLAHQSARQALRARIELWNAVREELLQ